MRIFKSFMVLMVFASCSMSALAQSYEQTDIDAEAQELGYTPFPYGFIQLQGGVGTTFTDVNSLKLLTPTFSVAVGGMFTPVVGGRLHVNGYQSKGGFDTMGQYYDGLTVSDASDGVWKLIGDPMTYKFSYINTNADVMINLVNIFSKKVRHPLDLYFIGGVGLNYTWENDDLERITSHYNVGTNVFNVRSDFSYNLRLGLLVDFNLSKHWSLGAEVDFNSLDDRFNSKHSDSDDWMMTAQASLTYKFGFKKARKPTPEAISSIPLYQDTKQSDVASAPTPKPVAPTPVSTPKPVVVEEEPIKETVFYAIRESDIENDELIEKVAAWCKKYPNKTIVVNGYADKGTGNPRINASYAKQRVDKVVSALQSKGVSAGQMTVNSYGDTVQPFEDNDKNRCVIIEGQ